MVPRTTLDFPFEVLSFIDEKLLQMLASDQDVIAAILIDTSSSSLKNVLKPRMSRLKKLLIKADQLRLQTLHQLFLVLSPVQVAHCAIAAFELAFSMYALGVSDQSRVRTESAISCAKLLPPKLPSALVVELELELEPVTRTRPCGVSKGTCQTEDLWTPIICAVLRSAR